jgi:hypothetical protein
MHGRLGIGLALLLLATIAQAEDSKVLVGGDLRLRGEAFDNVLDLTNSRSDNFTFYRMRPRLWVDGKPRDGLRVFFRLTDEYRWGRGEKVSGTRDADVKMGIDNAWADIRIAEGLSVRFGRQDLQYGEGFLVFDGTPADGSSTAFFDAGLATWSDETSKAKFDLFMSKIAETGFAPGSNDEDFYGIYARRDPGELYVLHRNQRAAVALGPGLSLPEIIHPKRKTTAIGGRVARLPDAGFHFAAEGAYQTGDFGEVSERAFGGYARAGYTVDEAHRLGIEVGDVYLSGDDPKTERFEGWDGFYSEWPKYSEGYVYTVSDGLTRIPLDDIGTWTNMNAIWIEGRVVPASWARAAVRVTRFLAVEKTGTGTGKDRGILVAGQVNLDLGAGLTGQILGESFDPGDFYCDCGNRAWYARWQVTAKF